MRRVTATLVFFLLFLAVTAQIAPNKYFVEFTNKSNSPFSIDRPWEFLSQRALDRRAISGIEIELNDLPVTPDYVEEVSLIGVDVITRSKWFNGITIYTTDTFKIAEIEQLPFVKQVVKNGLRNSETDFTHDKFAVEQASIIPLNSLQGIPLKLSDSTDYGISYDQVHMVRTDLLHDFGLRGQGMVIAVLDAGFNLVDQLAPFDSLWANNQILGTRDFVTPGGNVFIGHNHGMHVLSIMGGYVPGQLIGTAPKADYWLLRSEDTDSEYLVEEYNWVSAAEFADSVGAAIINSSLGYTVFNDSTQNHHCDDMTGNTTPVTRGANIAFTKGILVVNSAGNEGNNPNWQCVSAPSDGTDVLAVAAVDSLGQYASFSSKGVVNGSYVKPNVAAMGRLTVISSSDGTITRGSGTSFSSPVMAGSAACLWQAFPAYSNATVKMAIEESASLFTNPDIYLGYGIPNLFQAYERLTGSDPGISDGSLVIYPNPSIGKEPIHLRVIIPVAQTMQVQLVDMTGKQLFTRNDIRCAAGENLITLNSLSFLKQGIYILKIQNQDGPAFVETKIIQRLEQ
ncbi:MAG: S8 family serine peptidase [Bacteroidales bacterium]|nr:S8 family serine peptidase [Bacteroidales bacterium]